jgi:hypothetical protein
MSHVIISLCVTDGVMVTSLSASLQRKTRMTTDCVCHIKLNQKLLCIVYAKSCLTTHYRVNLKSGVNFQAASKRNRAKRNRI